MVFCTFDFLIQQGNYFFIEGQTAHQHCEEYHTATPNIQARALVVPMAYDFRRCVVETAAAGLQKLAIFHEIR